MRTLVQAAGVILLAIALGSPALAAEGFPVVDPTTQRQRDATRERILLNERAREQALLAKAQQELAGATAHSLPVEQRATLQAAVTQHQRNLQALDKEIIHLSAAPLHDTARAQAPVKVSARKIPPAQDARAWWDIYARPPASVYQRAPSAASPVTLRAPVPDDNIPDD